MALRLGDYVIRGELNNTKDYSTFGRLELAGAEAPFAFELTGNCDPDLRGKRIRFEAAPSYENPPELPKVAGHLIGVTGTITAANWGKAFECSTKEFVRRASFGEPPPTTWKRLLYFEFYSQHGRTLIELLGPKLEYDAGGVDGEDWRPLPEQERRTEALAEPDFPEIVVVHRTGEVEHIDPREYLDQHEASDTMSRLQRLLDSQNDAVERAIRGESDKDSDDIDGCIAEMELMDYLIDHKEGDPLALAFQTPRRLPLPDEIPEDQIEPLLKSLLAELALFNIALHVCEHYSLRDTYRLLVEKLHDEWTYHPELAGTGWVQNYMTSEYCPKCDEECDRDYEEFRKRNELEGDRPDDEDPPF